MPDNNSSSVENVKIHELKGKKTERDIAYCLFSNYVSKQLTKRMSYAQKWYCQILRKI